MTSKNLFHLAALVFAAIAFTANTPAAPETQAAVASAPIRVLTYNILMSKPLGEKNAKCEVWAKRKPLVLEIMRNKADGAPYDFIGTQETSTDPKPELNQVNQLAKEMAGYDSLYAACNGEENTPTPKQVSLSNMIFWRKDRWEIDSRDHGHFWLSDTPEVAGSNQWAADNKGGKRNVTYGLFHEIANGKRTGKKVYFFNTHLNVHVPDARAKSAFLIMERIRARATASAPIILTGDFNSRRDSIIYKYLTGEAVTFENAKHTPPFALKEAFAAVGPQDKLPRIDFIFSSMGLNAHSAANVDIDIKRDGLRPSDHSPIEAIFNWE